MRHHRPVSFVLASRRPAGPDLARSRAASLSQPSSPVPRRSPASLPAGADSLRVSFLEVGQLANGNDDDADADGNDRPSQVRKAFPADAGQQVVLVGGCQDTSRRLVLFESAKKRRHEAGSLAGAARAAAQQVASGGRAPLQATGVSRILRKLEALLGQTGAKQQVAAAVQVIK